MKAFARDKGELAGRYAEVYANADAFRVAADRLRFDLLLRTEGTARHLARAAGRPSSPSTS